jgi:hypothetical protein
MKGVSDRISILKQEDLLSIVILPGLDKKRLAAIFIWLVAWSLCGIVMFIGYFQTKGEDAKLFILVYLSFWFYFEYNIIRSYFWKKGGKEKLWIKGGFLHYQRELHQRGKIIELETSLVNPVELIELRPTRFMDTISQSFWIRGGERLLLQSQAKQIRFGMQLTDAEAKELRKEINKWLS